MLTPQKFGSLIAFSLLASACATRDENVIFVTKTSLGIDVEPTTSSASLAYDRVEGYSTPRFKANYIPQVYANFDHTGGTLFNPRIKQIYATGQAADTIAAANAEASPDDSEKAVVAKARFQKAGFIPEPSRQEFATKTADEETKRPMFFGTSTIFGLKLGFSQTALDGFNLGYKRKEVSVIPKKDHDPDFPSVLSTIETGVDAGPNPGKTRGEIRQFFATGTAADSLSKDPMVQEIFRARTQSALQAFAENERVQKSAALVSVACLLQVADASLPRVWADAEAQKLIPKEKATDLSQRQPQDARRQYVIAMYDLDHTVSENTPRMREHKAYVCGLAQR